MVPVQFGGPGAVEPNTPPLTLHPAPTLPGAGGPGARRHGVLPHLRAEP